MNNSQKGFSALLKKQVARFSKNQTTNDQVLAETQKDHKHSDKKLVSSLRVADSNTIKKLKFIKNVLSDSDKNLLRAMALLILACIVFIGGAFYFKNFSVIPVFGGEYTEGLIGSPEFINPLLSQNNDVDADLVSLIFSGLMRYDKNLELQTDLATNYEISEDQKSYTFSLRNNVTWHDGQPLSADDVVFTYQSIDDPDFKSPLSFGLNGVGIEKINDYEIQFLLEEPYPSFLEILTTGILPQHIWSSIPAVNANLTEYNIKPVGSGPWKFKTVFKDKLGNIKSYILVPNENYYGQKPLLQKLAFKFYPGPTFEPAVEALNNRSVEGLSFLPKSLEANIQNNQSVVHSLYLPQYTGIFFNQTKNEILKSSEVRRALAQSIDKTKILTEALRLKGEIIEGPILPGFVGYNPTIEKINFDPALALQSLMEQGWNKITPQEYEVFLQSKKEEEQKAIKASLSDDDLLKSEEETKTTTTTDATKQPILPQAIANAQPRQKFYLQSKDTIFEIRLTTVNLPENVKAAELVREFWHNIGVKVELDIVDDTKITREVIRPRDYDALLFGVIVGADPDPFPFWHSSQIQDPGLNLSNYANRNVDKLLEEARITSDFDKKNELYKQFQNLIIKDVPTIFLFNPTYSYVSHQKIQGFDIQRIILPSHRFNNITEWFIKTGRRWNGNLRR